MAKKYLCPPPASTGSATFSDDLVGFQLVAGGGLTQGNFQYTSAIFEKNNRTFDTGVFSQPFNLENLQIESIEQNKLLIEKNFKVFPNFDLSQITSFSLYGSLSKRLATSVTKIINFFPAALQIDKFNYNQTSGATAYNITYNSIENYTTFDVSVSFLKNPFGIDYSSNAANNLKTMPMSVSPLRDLTNGYEKYSLFFTDFINEYNIIDFEPSQTLTAGTLTFTVLGNPFSSETQSVRTLIIKPNKIKTEQSFKEDFDYVEQFLLNRNTLPLYTSQFSYPDYDSNGIYTQYVDNLTWATDGFWNLDIRTALFDTYLEKLQNIGEKIDEFKTNLISRFLVSGSLKEFDTIDQKLEKVLQIYGRSFDETKKFIDALGHMTSVNYIVGDDIPSQLLVNLAKTLGLDTKISPINNDDLLNSLFNTSTEQLYQGQVKPLTPLELNYQYYRNLILNAAFLFKSKGTRKSIEYILRMVGAPEQLIEFNEYIYIADKKISIEEFETKYATIESSGSIYIGTPAFNPDVTYSLYGTQYTSYTVNGQLIFTDLRANDYPIDTDTGYPYKPDNTEDYFFQKGAGWFERTPEHISPEVINEELSDFSLNPAIIRTKYSPFTYGQDYLDRYQNFPLLNIGYRLTKTVDNVKAWNSQKVGLRTNTTNMTETNYEVLNENLVINSKNMELYLNMGQGITYDIWESSVNYNYPIPNTGLTTPYPSPGLNDWTVINPKPNQKTFFEFAQTFYNNMINVRNRQTISDGKTGGYPTLQSIFWRYLQSEETVGIPNNKFTYQKMIDFTLGLGDYWVRLVEQFVPATTLWLTGQKFDNSIFHRQKVVWRRQRGCVFIAGSRLNSDCLQCTYNGEPYAYDCIDQTTSCSIPFFEPANVLSLKIQDVLASSGYTTPQCDTSTVVSRWYVNLRLQDIITSTEEALVNGNFYTGYGPFALDINTGIPLTYSQVLSAIDSQLQNIYQFGLNYYISGGNLIVSNSTCYDNFTNKRLKLYIGLEIEINCN
jgi:hypothetical protein